MTGPIVAPWEVRLERTVLALGRDPWGVSGGGRAFGLLRVFRLVEDILLWGHVVRPLRAGGVLRYELVRTPHDLPLAGEPPVRRGTRVIGLHFNNRAVTRLLARHPGSHAATWQFAHAAVADLRELAALVGQGTFPPDVRAAYGESLFYQAFRRYGFTTRPARRTLCTPFARLFLVTMLAIYGQEDVGGLSPTQQRRLHLGEAWIGTAALRRRFGPAAGESAITESPGSARQAHR